MILKYLKDIILYGLQITSQSNHSHYDYNDIDWAKDIDDYHNFGTYCVFHSKNLSLRAASTSRQLLITLTSQNINYCPTKQLKFNGFTLYCPPFLFHCLHVKLSGVTILKHIFVFQSCFSCINKTH